MEIAVGSLRRYAWPSGDGTVAVDEIRLLPQHALPFRGLLEQMMPGDRVVVRRVKAAVLDRGTYRVIGIPNQTVIPGETGEDCKIALGDAERHVGSHRVTPFGDDPAAAQHEAIRRSARPHRSEGFVPRGPLLEIAGDHDGKITLPWRFACASVPRGGGDSLGIESGRAGGDGRPICRMRRRKITHQSFLSTGRA